MKKIAINENETDEPSLRSTSSKPMDAEDAPRQTDQDDSLAGLQADLDRFRDLAMRSQADFENYKKRAAREKEEGIRYANKDLLERLVAIVDHFELGLEAAREESKKSPIVSGMSLVLKQLQDLLTESGLQPIDAVGQKFDPNLHEAIAHEPSDDVADHFVIRQTRRGYKFRDRLLRPSSVVVSSGPAK
jgi:molecular chaperone GrpE